MYKISSTEPSKLKDPELVTHLKNPRNLLGKKSFRKSKLDPDSILIFGNQDQPSSYRDFGGEYCIFRFNTSTLKSEEINFELNSEGTNSRYTLGFLTTPKDRELVVFSKLAVAIFNLDFERLQVEPKKIFGTKEVGITDCRLSPLSGSPLVIFIDQVRKYAGRKEAALCQYLKEIELDFPARNNVEEVKAAIERELDNMIRLQYAKLSGDRLFGLAFIIDLPGVKA